MIHEVRPASEEDVRAILDEGAKERGVAPFFGSAAGLLCLLEEGKPVAVGGTIPIWEGHSIALGLVSRAARSPLALYRFALSIVEKPKGRVWAFVRSDFKEGVRFIERLGFVREGLLERFGPDGADYFSYARFND
jgi:hypothetical protein